MRIPSVRVIPLALALALATIAAAPASAPPPASLDALFPPGRLTVPLDALAGRYPLEPGREFQVTEIGRDANSSHHVVWIVDREVPHRHDTHDLFVVMVEGYGTMRLGAEQRPVGRGSILYVPRGTPHAFANESGKPALAYAVYVPAFDGKDRMPVD